MVGATQVRVPIKTRSLSRHLTSNQKSDHRRTLRYVANLGDAEPGTDAFTNAVAVARRVHLVAPDSGLIYLAIGLPAP